MYAIRSYYVAEVLVRPGPTGGVDARRAVEGDDAEAGIVGEGGQARGGGGGFGLEPGVVGEGFAGFLRNNFV